MRFLNFSFYQYTSIMDLQRVQNAGKSPPPPPTPL